ncbi:MAG: hypothetical protein KKH08_06650 [Candidatus Omnitrophica bacterium]|nr:hypothetical protein [Candidatus Omnitrophota bacterium]
MIEINLLPESLRQKKQFRVNLDIKAAKVRLIGGAAIAGLLVFLVILFSVGASIRKSQSSGLLSKEQSMAQKRTQVETVNKDVSILSAKMTELGKIIERKFLWAEKLNQLSDLVLPGIWFTRVYVDPDNRFIIEGSVISSKQEAMASVGKFMKDVRESKAFFKDFENIKLESAQRKTLDKRDIVEFKIVLYFRG